MTMAVVSSQSLDDLQATVDKVFAAAAEADVPPPADLAEDAAKAPAVAAAGAALVETAALAAGLPGGAHPWDAPGAAPEPFVLRLAPVKSARTLRVLWPLPGDVADHRSARGGANRYISHLLGHEGEGSIFAALQVRPRLVVPRPATLLTPPPPPSPPLSPPSWPRPSDRARTSTSTTFVR